MRFSLCDGLHNVQARDALLKETAAVLKTRRAALARGDPLPNDILTRLMTEKDAEGAQLSNKDLQDIMLALLFAGKSGTSMSCQRTPLIFFSVGRTKPMF
jgi:cytochrome P450